MGIELAEREDGAPGFIKLKSPYSEFEEYEILQDFPFKSETKRMGIIIRHRLSNKLIFYVKGADTAMVEMVKPSQRSSCKEHCEYLALEGLRTLVITQRLLRESEYEEFEKKLTLAKADISDDKEQLIQKVIESLEHEMEFLCVTGVEDKLQEDVLKTIETLRQAGI